MTVDTKEQPGRAIYYGWYIVLALAITETFSYGIIYYSFQVFITPMQMQMDWSLAQISGASSLALLISGFVTLPVGIWLDKYGARLLMTVASILATLLLIAWSFVQTLPMLYAIWILLGFTMAMLFYDPAFVVAANWFNQRRSLALALITFIAGFASTIFLPLADYLLQMVGWRSAVLILAIMYGLVTIPLHGFVLRRRPEDIGLMPDGKAEIAEEVESNKDIIAKSVGASDAIRSRSFFLLTIAFGLITLASMAIRYHFIPYAITTGIDATTAAWFAGFIGATQVLGRLIFAPLEMRFSSPTMMFCTMLTIVIAFVILIVSQSLIFVGLFVVVFGAGFGAMTLVRPLILGELYGTRHYGRINSVMSFMMIFVATLAPIGTSLMVEWTGDYQIAIYLLTAIAFLSLIPVLKLHFDKRKPEANNI